MSRSRALKLNMCASLLSELVTFVSGLILPRLILVYFGSSCNGLVGSISQFLGFSAILRAGMGGAIRAALYKPLAENNCASVDAIMSATNKHMKKIAYIIGAAILVFSLIYPTLVRNEYNWLFAFTMVLIIGSSTFVDNFFGIKCKILLQADQKYYIQIGSGAIASVFSTIVSIILIVTGNRIEIVKIGAAIALLINPIILNLYVRKHYSVNWNAKPDETALKQRWDAFFQQVATVINENIDLSLLTLFVALKEISVYTVHFMVANNIGKIVNSCVQGINSTFGNIIARGEKENLKTVFSFIEWIVFVVSIVLYSVTAIMLPGFITLYTKSINDVNYLRPAFAIIMVVTMLIKSSRIPYQMLVEADGRFKETRNGAILEAILNLVLSAVLVYFYGIIGVLIGTLVSGSIRTFELAIFCMRKILHTNWVHILKHYIVMSITFGVILIAGKHLIPFEMTDYLRWTGNAAIVTVFSLLISIGVSLVFYRSSLLYFLQRIKRRLSK